MEQGFYDVIPVPFDLVIRNTLQIRELLEPGFRIDNHIDRISALGKSFGDFQPSYETHIAGGKMLEIIFSIYRCYPNGSAHVRLIPRFGHCDCAAGFCVMAETARKMGGLAACDFEINIP
jgi:hypothetical protein